MHILLTLANWKNNTDMKTEDFNKVDDNKLIKEERSRKILLIVFSIFILIMIVAAIYSTITKGVAFVTYLPLFFLPIAVTNYLRYNEARKEMIRRKLI